MRWCVTLGSAVNSLTTLLMAQDLLHNELDEALEQGVQMLLVHEQRPGKGVVPFSYFVDSRYVPLLCIAHFRICDLGSPAHS